MFISLDLETTGFNPEKDKIIEFGAIKFDLNGHNETLDFLVDPEMKIPEIITHITNIRDEDVKGAVKFPEKIQEVQEFIGDYPIIGHNIQFDTNFLRGNGITIENPEYDTHPLSKMLLPDAPSHSLEILTQLLGLTHESKHRALDDAIAAKELFIKMIHQFQTLDPETIEAVKEICNKSDWHGKKLLIPLEHNKKLTPINLNLNDPQKKTAPDLEAKAKKILELEKNTLIESKKPYPELTLALAEKIHPDSYLAIPYETFKKLNGKIPDHIAELDRSSNYFSPQRFQKFLQQEKFNDHETTAAIKTLLWSKRTKTGHLSELSLFQKENEILSQISADENVVNIENEIFIKKARQKDQKSAAICSHDYLQNLDEDCKKLFIFDFESLSKNLRYQSSIYLTLERFTSPLIPLMQKDPDNKTIESLFNSATILFGLIGIIFENTNDKNPYKARSIVNHFDLKSTEWLKITKIIDKLIAISLDLKEFVNEETLPFLQKWKQKLEEISKTFKDPELESNLVIIEQDQHERPVLRKIPNEINHILDNLLTKPEQYYLVDENFDLDDDGSFIKGHFSLDPDMPIKKIDEHDQELKQIYVHSQASENEHKNLEEILALLQKENCGGTAVICNSLRTLKSITLQAKKAFADTPIKIVSKLTGSVGKIATQFKEDPENAILIVTPNIWLRLEKDNIYPLINRLIIQKTPFSPPSDPYLTAESQKYPNPFLDYQVPDSVIKLRKILNRLPVNQEVIIDFFDPRVVKKSYGKSILANLKLIGKVEII